MLHLMTPSPETTPSPGDDARWNAVQRRDRAADGTFVYSVRTTGVYCRPSCAARLPRRENVAFHQTSPTPNGRDFGRANAAARMSPHVPTGRLLPWRRRAG